MASGNDMKAHDATFGGFMSLVKVTCGVVAIVTIAVVWLISR